MKRSEIFFGIIKVPLDYLAAAIGFYTAYLIRAKTDLIPGVQLDIGLLPDHNFYVIYYVLIGALTIPLVFAFNGMYSLKSSHGLGAELKQVLFLSTAWVMLVIVGFFLTRQFFFSRLILIYGWILATALIFVARILVRVVQRMCLKAGIGRYKVLFIGNNKLTAELARKLKKGRHYEITGVLSGSSEKQAKLPVLGTIHDLEECIKKYHIDEIIQTNSNEEEGTANTVMELCRIMHVRYRFVPDLVEVQMLNIDVNNDFGIPLIELKPTPLDGWGRVLKRIMDIVGSLLGMIILSPFIIGTAIAVWTEQKSFTQILFRQSRVGLHGDLFICLKFQSMKQGAEKEHMKLLETQSERSGLLKIKEDPRVTKVGKIIRKTSLDELPQLWNILKGDMSLVGPRPHMPSEVEKIFKNYSRVLTVKPGLTGLAQVSGRSSLSFEEEIKVELSYIENWSLKQDILIIFKTVLTILKRENAS